MLLELSCSNFKAIKEKIIFSMVASGDKSHEEELYAYKDYRVSRFVSVYGANGAGKTTLIEAVGYLCFLVVCCVNFQEGDPIPRMPHKLDVNKPTTYNVQFVVDGIRYVYGFSINDKEILEEYLYHFPSGRQAKIFDRVMQDYTYGASYKRELSQLEAKSKRNKLFLSTAEAWSKLPEILNPFKFFKEQIVVHTMGPDNWFVYSARQIRENPASKKMMITFLQKIGLPILDIRVKIETRQLTPQDVPVKIFPEFHSVAGTLQSNVNIIEVKFVYKDYELDIQEESQGTQKLFQLLCPLVDVLANGKILFYDKLEDSLHPALVDELVKTFKEWEHGNGAQLVFSTHDTTLLDLDVFRRDQIWFAERNPKKSTTEYYSLIELKNVRKDENIRKGYIHGKYSTIPLKGSSLIEVLGDDGGKELRT